MLINFVISKDLKSRIFYDIFRRFLARQGRHTIRISEAPIDDADIYHYHRIHLEEAVRKPSVATVHHDPFDLDPWLPSNVFLDRYRQLSAIVCLNTVQQTHLAKHGLTNTVVIPHGYDQTLFHRSARKPPEGTDKIRLGVVSKRYDRRFKGEVLLEELAQRLNPECFAFRLVGEGRIQDAAMLRRYGFDVDATEWLPYRLFPALYETIDLLLMLSNFEGGPANIPEAVGAGVPIICTPIGMAVDYVSHGQNGYFTTGNPNTDAHNIQRLYDDKSELQRLINGAKTYRAIPTWDDIIVSHMELYQSIVHPPTSPTP